MRIQISRRIVWLTKIILIFVASGASTLGGLEGSEASGGGPRDHSRPHYIPTQAQLAEAKMIIIERQHEIDTNEQMRIKSSLQRELERVKNENETLQKVLKSEDYKNANEKRAQTQYELKKARYENELLKAQNEAKIKCEQERIKRMTSLTLEQYQALDTQYITSIKGLYQQQLIEEEKQRTGLRVRARFERSKEAEIEQQRKTVDEEIKAQELGAYQTAVGPNQK
ncbi:uncharacterized protein GO595_003892 [Histomonas meleagridis]|uniref:uncharacterized protein n=1 Tax=Histomonas meleagridis TaxID=135588 RepID=UPI00355AA94F|nr:hypothetical protein GO595_003892 [Histomonas meleagridis]